MIPYWSEEVLTSLVEKWHNLWKRVTTIRIRKPLLSTTTEQGREVEEDKMAILSSL